MPVGFPIPGVLIDFDVSREFLTIDEDQSAAKIRPGLAIPNPKVNDFDCFTILAPPGDAKFPSKHPCLHLQFWKTRHPALGQA